MKKLLFLCSALLVSYHDVYALNGLPDEHMVMIPEERVPLASRAIPHSFPSAERTVSSGNNSCPCTCCDHGRTYCEPTQALCPPQQRQGTGVPIDLPARPLQNFPFLSFELGKNYGYQVTWYSPNLTDSYSSLRSVYNGMQGLETPQVSGWFRGMCYIGPDVQGSNPALLMIPRKYGDPIVVVTGRILQQHELSEDDQETIVQYVEANHSNLTASLSDPSLRARIQNTEWEARYTGSSFVVKVSRHGYALAYCHMRER